MLTYDKIFRFLFPRLKQPIDDFSQTIRNIPKYCQMQSSLRYYFYKNSNEFLLLTTTNTQRISHVSLRNSFEEFRIFFLLSFAFYYEILAVKLFRFVYFFFLLFLLLVIHFKVNVKFSMNFPLVFCIFEIRKSFPVNGFQFRCRVCEILN